MTLGTRGLLAFLFMSIILFIISYHGSCGTIVVDDDNASWADHESIQDAINVSSNGDTIIVRPGTYVENIDFVGKAIHLRSEMGPEVTVVDGCRMGRCFLPTRRRSGICTERIHHNKRLGIRRTL